VFEGLSSFHVNDCVCTVVTSAKKAGSNAVIGWFARCAPALCNAGSNAVVVSRRRPLEVSGGLRLVWGGK
jgi:hypothetical protein